MRLGTYTVIWTMFFWFGATPIPALILSFFIAYPLAWRLEELLCCRLSPGTCNGVVQ